MNILKVRQEKSNREKIESIVKGALLAGAGAAVAYAVEAVSATDWGHHTALVTAIAAIVANALRQYLLVDKE